MVTEQQLGVWRKFLSLKLQIKTKSWRSEKGLKMLHVDSVGVITVTARGGKQRPHATRQL